MKNIRSRGQQAFHFGFGESPFPVPDLLVKELIKHAGEKKYLPCNGLPELREAIAEFFKKEYGLLFDKENIIPGNGSKELIYYL